MKNKTRKKILLYTRPLVPPWDEASKNLAYEITRNSHGLFEFHALTSKSFSGKLLESVKKSKSKKVIAEPIYKTGKFGGSEKASLLFRLFKPRLEADIIHFLFTPRLFTSMLIKFRLFFSGVKTIQTIATIGKELRDDHSRLKQVLFGDKIITQSKHTKKKLINIGIKNVEAIYPGIDTAKFSPASKNEEIMEQLGILTNDFVILFAGEYARLHAIDDIINALEELIDQASLEEKNYKLILACRIKSDKDLQKKHQAIEYVQRKGLEKRVVFLDMCKDMPALYSVSDVNIFPARKMTGKFDIPFVIIEAMSCRRPVIVTNIPVLMEFVSHRETGLIVKKADPAQLARAIKLLNQDSNIRERIAENACRFARDNFDIRKNVEQYERLYNEL